MSNKTAHQITEDLVARQLSSGNFPRSTAQLTQLSDPIVDTPMVVTLDQLRAYDKNPRTTRNSKYDEIKASIIARGLDHPPPITRRPGEEHFTIAGGGNTRLAILNELWRETQEERFYRINCLFKPWRGEISAMIGHLAENDTHGVLSYIERAVGVSELRALYEAEGGSPLNQSQLAARLKADGYPTTQSNISKMLASIEYLLPAIPTSLYAGLARSHIEKLLSLRGSLAAVHKKYSADEDAFAQLWIVTLSMFDTDALDELNHGRIADEMIDRLSALVGEDYRAIELDLEELRSTPRTTRPTEAEVVTTAATAEGASAATAVNAEILTPANSQSTTATATSVESAASAVTPPAPSAVSGATGTTDSAPIRPAPAVASAPTGQGQVSTGAASEELDEAERQARIDAHIVSPTTLTERVQQIHAFTEQALGGSLPDFEECAVTAIPVQAGGLANVSDVWYIEKRINTIEGLRSQIHLLAREIAIWGGGRLPEMLIECNEGLGFGMQPPPNPREPGEHDQKTATATLLLMSLLRIHDTSDAEVNRELPAALFGQILVGAYDIQIGHSPAEEIDLVRLPDVLLIKLFRLIRLARVLVDIVKQES